MLSVTIATSRRFDRGFPAAKSTVLLIAGSRPPRLSKTTTAPQAEIISMTRGPGRSLTSATNPRHHLVITTRHRVGNVNTPQTKGKQQPTLSAANFVIDDFCFCSSALFSHERDRMALPAVIFSSKKNSLLTWVQLPDGACVPSRLRKTVLYHRSVQRKVLRWMIQGATTLQQKNSVLFGVLVVSRRHRG